MRGDRRHPALAAATAAAAAIERLRAAGALPVAGALVLGSGLSWLADELQDAVTLPYADIPGFPVSTVPGHRGAFVVGSLDGVPVAAAQGRLHLYEGYDAAAAVLHLQVLRALEPQWLLLTNAAGSLDERLGPGSLMAIRDHINLQFSNPLRGRAPAAVTNPFPDLCRGYDPVLLARLHQAALAEGIRLAEGVYAAVLGPSYETPAEVRFLREIGADAVGMSTVAEVIQAAEWGLPVAAVSLITNLGTGLADELLT
ncbi:MAG: purine-nucleoside phosphorylase, partial [Gemmatimonadota bacterium]